jgi:hypothetical protein
MKSMRSWLWLVTSLGLFAWTPHLHAQRPPFDSVVAEKGPGMVCYHHSRYIVVQRAAAEVGSDLFVRSARSARCDPDSLPGDFVWRNRDADYFLGLRGDLLFIDGGTGPDLRSLLVIDLRTRRRLLETDYVGDVIAGPDSFTLGIWRGYELAKPAPICPKTELIPGVDSLIWVDLRTGVTRFANQTRCAERQ